MTPEHYFMECSICSAEPGTPPLCGSCLHNRTIIDSLVIEREVLGSALWKFAPDLMEELILRHKASKNVGDLIAYLQSTADLKETS